MCDQCHMERIIFFLYRMSPKVMIYSCQCVSDIFDYISFSS